MNTSVVVTDASVWVARFIAQEPHHQACVTWLSNFAKSGGEIVAPVLLLSEVCGALSRRTAQPHLARAVYDAMTQSPEITFVEINHELAQRAAQLTINLQLRGADATYVALADKLGAALISLDAEHHQRAGKPIQTLQPV